MGPPTFFITLSADDNNWTDLMVVLSKCKGHNLSEEQASELSTRWRIPAFWRIEFQLRGSPRVHSMWWIKDAPNLDTATGRQVAPQYIDQYISVGITKESDGKLRELVLCFQQHHHTSTYKKTTRRRGNVAECRFDLFVRKHV